MPVTGDLYKIPQLLSKFSPLIPRSPHMWVSPRNKSLNYIVVTLGEGADPRGKYGSTI
jgi:hypothetical protein